MCGVPFHAADGYIARLVKKGLPRRHLRAGGGPEEGQGARQARGRARRLAGHADRRRVSRCARAGLPDGASCPTRRRPGYRRRAARPLHRRIHRRRIPRAGRAPGAGRRDRGAAAARDRRARPTRRSPSPCSRNLRLQAAGDHGRAWTFESEAARRALLDQMQTQALEGFGLDDRTGRRSGGWRAGPLSARHAEGRPRARPRDRVPQPAPTAWSIDPTTLKHLEVIAGSGGRPRRIAAARDRSHDHADGRPPAPRWLLRPLCRARAHPGSSRRGRRVRLPAAPNAPSFARR